MKLFSGFLTLFVALVISGVAAYFSVVGLAAIFPATFWAVVLMGVSLEVGKLVAAGWIHSNWKNELVSKLHRGYMVAAVVVLMLITGLGIFGFLSKGHMEQEASGAPVALQIAQRESRIEQLNTQIVTLNARQTQLDTAVNSIIADNATGGLRARRQQTSERAEITKGVEAANAEINTITSELVPLKLEVAEVDAKLGPIKFAAEAVGLKDPEVAVRIIILMIMVAFDPLAIVLVLSGTMTIHAALEERRRRREKPVSPMTTEPPPHPEPDEDVALVFETDDDDIEWLADEEAEEEVATTTDHVDVLTRVTQAHEEHFRRVAAEAEAAARAAVQAAAEAEEEEQRSLILELEESLPKDDEQVLLEILERRPELLQNVIDAVKDEPVANTVSDPEPAEQHGWIDADLNIPPR